MEQRYVGILVNNSLYKGIPNGDTHHECLHFYEEAGRRYDVIPCYFRLQDIKPGIEEVMVLLKDSNDYIQKKIPTPRIIHNRTIYSTSSTKNQIINLAEKGKIIFNQWNRYEKLQIHQLLMLNMSLRPHLPSTMSADLNNLQQMMKQFDSLILKPSSSSIGHGIMKMERVNKGWRLIYPCGKNNKLWNTITSSHSIPEVIKHRFQKQPFIIQQFLPLATYKGRPFDLRVSIQRNINGGWQITGIVGKVAKKKAFLTNVAKGGTVHSFESLIRQNPAMDYEHVYDKVSNLALNVAQHLEKHLPYLSDIGLDIGITENGFPMFIECNGRDLRYSFQKAHMIEQWKSTYSNPIGYARYLMDKK